MKRTNLSLACLVVAGGLAGLLVPAPAAANDEDYRIDLRTSLPDGEFVVFKGQSFDLSLATNYDSYVTVLALDKKGNVRVLFPNRYQRDNFVPEGRDVRVRDIYADYTGPVYIEAIAMASEGYYFRFGDRRAPLWNERFWEGYDPSRSFLSDRRGTFTVSFDDAISHRPPVGASGYDPDRLERELQQHIDDDYADFEGMVRDFRDEIYEVVGGESWASGYADVYVADSRFNVSGRPGYGETYEAPSGSSVTFYSSYYDYDRSDFDYDAALSGYGSWIDVRGIRVWRPPVFSFAWRPYVNGYWTHTRYGWYWVGYEPFAWVTYHYGYWYYDPFYGWYWIPDYWDYRFVPANCYWYSSGTYIGWYPAPPPARIAARLNITVSAHFDMARAVVVRKENFLHANIQDIVEAPQRVSGLLRDARPSFTPEAAPRKDVIARAVGHSITDAQVKTIEKSAAKANKEITIVKPVEMRAVPKQFQDLDQKVKKEVLSGKPAPRSAPAPATTKPAPTRPGTVAPPARETRPKPAPSTPPTRATPRVEPKPVTPGKPKPRPPVPDAAPTPPSERPEYVPPRPHAKPPTGRASPPPTTPRARPAKPAKGEEAAPAPKPKPKPAPTSYDDEEEKDKVEPAKPKASPGSKKDHR